MARGERGVSKMQVMGNSLIAGSLVGLVLIYWPIVRFAIGIGGEEMVPVGTDKIVIKRVGAVAPLVWDVDPWDEAEYTKKLNEGVAQAKGSALPGQSGTVFLFAHSSLPAWEMTRKNTAFLFLGQIGVGDEIELYRDGLRYDYVVTSKKTVWPSEVKEIETKSDLVLMTCTPVGTSLRRLLVFAGLKE